jgi:hypothetical protein
MLNHTPALRWFAMRRSIYTIGEPSLRSVRGAAPAQRVTSSAAVVVPDDSIVQDARVNKLAGMSELSTARRLDFETIA